MLNPVRAGIVRYPGDYEWSSYNATAGLGASPKWLAVDEVLAEFGPGSRAERCSRYRDFVADGRGAEYKPWEQLAGQIYLGGAAFCDRMQVLVGTKREARAYPAAQRNVVRSSLEVVVALVADAFRLDERQLRRRSHHPARKALARLLSHQAGLPFTIIGDWMGISGPAAAHLARKAVELEKRDPEFAAHLRQLRRALDTAENHTSQG